MVVRAVLIVNLAMAAAGGLPAFAQTFTPPPPPVLAPQFPAYPRTGASPFTPAAPGPQAPAAPGGPAAPPFVANSKPFEPGRILAIVEGEPILEGDIIGLVNQALLPHKDQMPANQYEEQRKGLTMRLLQDAINNKILYAKFVESFPPEARKKVLPKAREQVNGIFDQEELPKLLKKANVETAAELDAKFREFGYSLGKHKRMHLERMLGSNIVMQNVPKEPEVTHEEMLEYYREHASDYEHKARARWEQLTVLFSNFNDRREAFRTIAAMGDAVVLGTPFAAVARKGSQELRAADGGLHDWTFQGSLASDVIDREVFSLPIQKLSRIFEDDRGLHIIRVLEREAEGRRPFEEIQIEIRNQLSEKKRNEAMQKFVQEARRKAQVVTFLDDEAPERR